MKRPLVLCVVGMILFIFAINTRQSNYLYRMKLVNILSMRQSIREAYSTYLPTVLSTLNTPEKFTALQPNAITQIAQLITALSVISNDKFKETLKLTDSDVLNYITKLGSDSSVAAKLVEISKKSPSQLTALTTLLADFQKLDQGKKQELVGQITKLDAKLQALCAELEKTTAQEKQEIDKVAQTAVPNLTL